jgi:hypothetical protein
MLYQPLRPHPIFTIIIYDRNAVGQYYETTIVANLTMIIENLALAWSINYDLKVRCKLKRTFTIVTILNQATGVNNVAELSFTSTKPEMFTRPAELAASLSECQVGVTDLGNKKEEPERKEQTRNESSEAASGP